MKEHLKRLEEKGSNEQGYFSLDANKEITAEELEAYRLKRQCFDDPMAQ